MLFHCICVYVKGCFLDWKGDDKMQQTLSPGPDSWPSCEPEEQVKVLEHVHDLLRTLPDLQGTRLKQRLNFWGQMLQDLDGTRWGTWSRIADGNFGSYLWYLYTWYLIGLVQRNWMFALHSCCQVQVIPQYFCSKTQSVNSMHKQIQRVDITKFHQLLLLQWPLSHPQDHAWKGCISLPVFWLVAVLDR